MAIVTERDDAGQAIRVTGVARDISEQVAVESAYQKQSGYLKGILSHLPQGITVFDETLRLKYWNDSATEVLALPPEIVVPDVRFEDLIM
ncbi:PAS-domain containing protein, partial [Arthrospira platensis SPKY2]